jgi:hypothetical protein
VDTLEALGGEASVAELATQLGKPADGLYYHLRLLSRGGLLLEIKGQSRAGRDERRYRVHSTPRKKRPAPPLELVYEPENRANRKQVCRVVQSMLRITHRDFVRAMDSTDVVVEGPARELWAARGKGWVDATELEEMNTLLARLSHLLRRSRKGPGDRLVSLCFVLAPVPAKPARRKTAKE